MFCPINDHVKSKLVHKYIKLKHFIFTRQLKFIAKNGHPFVHPFVHLFVCLFVHFYFLLFLTSYFWFNTKLLIDWSDGELIVVKPKPNQTNNH